MVHHGLALLGPNYEKHVDAEVRDAAPEVRLAAEPYLSSSLKTFHFERDAFVIIMMCPLIKFAAGDLRSHVEN